MGQTSTTPEEQCDTCKKKILADEKGQTNGKCSDCFYEDQSIKKGIVSEEDVLKDLEETLEEAKSLCDQERRTEEEQWNRTEVIKEVFTFERNLETPGVHQDQTDHGEKLADVSESESSHLLCRKFQRLLSQEPTPTSDCLSQVQGKIITKLCCTAQSNSANIEHLSNMVQTVCQAALLTPLQKWTLSQNLLHVWQSMLNMEYPETVHSLSPHLHCWSTKEMTEEHKKGLIVLELLLTKLDLLAKKKEEEQDKAWLNAEKECLKFILNEIELDANISSVLLGITGPNQWTGVQSLQLLVSLARRKPPSSEAGHLLELLQRYHVTATWRERGGKTVPEILLTEVTLKELCEMLKDQLAEDDERQFKTLRRQNSTRKSKKILQVTCEKLKAKNMKWKWIETAISASVIILLVEYMADYFGPLFHGVVCTAFCALFFHAIAFRKKDNQKAAIEQKQQPEHVLEVCKAMVSFKGLSPSYYQMETLCELAYSRRRRPWRLVSVVSDDPSLAAMLTALNAKRSERVGVLQDMTSHQLGDWQKFYQMLNISVGATEKNTKGNTGTLRKTVVFGHLQSFINDYVQHYPWVSKEDEVGSALRPNHLILGGYLPAESLKFNNLSEEATLLQLPLCTLTDCAGDNASQKVEFISIIFFALKALAEVKGTESFKYVPDDKLAHICETFSGESPSRKQLSLLRLLEIILRCVHERQQRHQEAKKELPFEGTLYMMCFDVLMKSAREICLEEYLQDSLVILSNLVQRQLWDPIEVLDLFSLLTEKLGRSGGFHKKVVSALKLVNPLKFQRETPCPQTLSSVVKTLHLMTVNRVSASFKDLQERSIKEILEGQSTNLYEELQEIMQMDREKSLNEILDEIQQSQDIEAHFCDTTRSIVEHVMNTPLNEADIIQRVSDLTGAKDDPENLKRILLCLCFVVEKTMSLKPRITQMVSWCLLVLSKTGRLLQLGTGEGKSCVVAMFAAYRAKVCEENVDILSSSPVLAKRDAESWRPFYDCLQITVDCNADKLSDETRKKCYESTVVYGTVECFAADCLRQDFEKKDIRPNRGFHCIIVDEVDSLLLDKGIQTTYLSQDMPALQHLEIILAVIWSMVSVYDFVTDSEGCNVIQGPLKPFYKALFDIIGHEQELGRVVKLAQEENIIPSALTETHMSHIENLKSVDEDSMINFFCRAEKELRITFSIYTQDEHGHLQLCPESHCGGVPLLVLNEGHCCELFFDRGMLCSAVEDGVKSRLSYSKGDTSSAPKPHMDHCVLIPSFLEGLVNHKIGVWIRNAFQALEMQENEKYKVECGGIYPVDFEHTGMVERNKKWGDGLQQFIEMKHQRMLSNMSVITNYLSNATFFKKYSGQIFGTTGTLGDELKTLRSVYHGLQACMIPPFKQSKLFEAETIIVDDENSWRERICSAVLKQTRKTHYRGARATLVICETIKKATILSDSLKLQMDKDEKKLLKLYIDTSDEGDLTTQELGPGDIIVATNLAGRGTDFQVSQKVKNAGGLFVILTFLASNSRVEQQAFGRSARQGSPGSAQLMLCSLHLPENVQLELQSYKGPEAVRVEMAKRARDKLSELRTSETLKHDLPIITQREELFSTYCTILDKYCHIKDTQLRQMTVAMLNEFWGIWLLMKSEDIKYHKTKQLTDDLKIQITQAQESFKQNNSPHSSIYHYIKFANKLLAQREYEKSSELYTKAIELDSNWAAIAFYFRALCSYKMQNKENMYEDSVDEVVRDLEKAKESVNLFTYQCQVIQCLLRQSERNVKHSVGRVQSDIKEHPTENIDPKKQNITKELDVTHDNRLQGQITARMNMWAFFLNNIEKVIGEIHAFKGVEMKATMSLVKSPSMDDHRAMYRLYQLGLERVFGARDSFRFRWEGLAIIGLGATQILAGIAIGDIGLNLLNLEGPFGVLTKQGYKDILTGISALTTGEFSFNTWKNDKVASFCVDISANVPNESIRRKIHKALNIPQVESSPQKNTMNIFKIMAAQIKHDFMKEKNVQYKEEVKEEGSSDIKHLCDSVKESIKKKSKEAMKEYFRNEPLQTLMMDVVNIQQEPKFIFAKSSLEDKLKDVFMELTERAIETSCNGKNQPQLISKITKGLHSEVEERLKANPDSITSAMRTEYEVQWKGSAPDALMAIANDFNKDLCRLLEDLLEKMKAKGRKPKNTFQKDDVKTFRRDLYKSIRDKLYMALYDLLQMTLEHQQLELLSSAIMGQVNKTIKANRSQLRMPRRIGKQRRRMIRQNTKHILSKLERDHDHIYTEL